MISLSVVIPAYNEAERLWPTLSALAQFLPDFLGHTGFEVILVSDGSTDETDRLMQRWIRHCRVSREQSTQWQLIRLPVNQGKGAAVRVGMLAAMGKSRLLMDADGATPLEALPLLFEKISEGADLVIGSRAVPKAHVSLKTRWHRHLLGRCFHAAITHLLPDLHDTQCGFKLIRDDAARTLFADLKLSRYLFDVELLMRARSQGFKISEVAVPWRDVPGSKLNGFRDAPNILQELILLYWIAFNLKKSISTRQTGTRKL